MSIAAIPADSEFSIFLLGATGFIGGSFLTALRAGYPRARISALVRSEKDKPVVFAAGVQNVILGNNTDLEVVRSAAQEADVVVNAANADDVDLVTALLEGIGRSKVTSGRLPIFLHISGCALVAEHVGGDFSKAKLPICDDLDETSIRNIPPTALHRNVDDLIFAADTAGKVNAYIIAPSAVYGLGTGPVKTQCIVFPAYVAIARQNGVLFYPGNGTTTWDEVHITDLTSLFMLIFGRAISAVDPAGTSSYTKFYWAATRMFVWRDLTEAGARALYKHGLLKSPNAISLPPEEALQKGGIMLFLATTNCRVVSNRARSIGWAPRVSQSMTEYMEEGIVAAVKNPESGRQPFAQ